MIDYLNKHPNLLRFFCIIAILNSIYQSIYIATMNSYKKELLNQIFDEGEHIIHIELTENEIPKFDDYDFVNTFKKNNKTYAIYKNNKMIYCNSKKTNKENTHICDNPAESINTEDIKRLIKLI